MGCTSCKIVLSYLAEHFSVAGLWDKTLSWPLPMQSWTIQSLPLCHYPPINSEVGAQGFSLSLHHLHSGHYLHSRYTRGDEIVTATVAEEKNVHMNLGIWIWRLFQLGYFSSAFSRWINNPPLWQIPWVKLHMGNLIPLRADGDSRTAHHLCHTDPTILHDLIKLNPDGGSALRFCFAVFCPPRRQDQRVWGK